ncbi:hypothetical protein LCGC14_1081640 [marine sediment metagenome]|uniref:Uncharacterized protein n=1 Tax=marine sediment metagenome TaxID=412755 RepID=A0A0F9QKY5_9ZZZZ
MRNQDTQDRIEFDKEKNDKIQKLYNTIMAMPEPDIFGSGEQTEEEKELYSKISHAKSNFRIRKGVGMMCKCGHGKLHHTVEVNSRFWWSDTELKCNRKTCKCYAFSKKT